jgi:MoaA/NifB/PqqE/SkfB family radical SAM enzyme
MCSREIDKPRVLNDITVNDLIKSLDNLQFNKINYCGNDGDPLMCKDILQILNYFSPIEQEIHTNGSLRSNEFWIKLSKIPNLTIVFAIDGATKTSHEKYRVNTDFQKILNNAKIFNESGGNSWWQFIVFEHNKCEIDDAKKLAKELGFKKFELVYSRRNEINGIKPIQIIKNKFELQCKSLKREEIYIRSDGEVFPCVYHGDKNNYSGLNIKNKSLKEIVFDIYFDKFNFNNSICKTNCNSSYNNHRERFNL